MCKVSVIVPVYNTEKYLKECLESIVNQTLDDIEIICVNDGSTDNSLDILKDYAKDDSRIKIISQENNGQGSARNKGLSIAKGDYIYFMDSDDIIELDTLKDCYNIMKDYKIDFVMFQLINFDEEKGFYQIPDYDMLNVWEFVGDNIFSYKDLGDLIFQVAVSPVNKLYNKQFLEDIKVRFPEDIIFEDNIFFWNVFLNAKRIKFIKQHYYIRRRHSFSTTGRPGIRFVDTLEIHNRIFDIFKKIDIFDEYKEFLFNKKIGLANVRFNQVAEEFKSEFFVEMKKDFEEMINENGYEFIIDCLNEYNKLFLNNVLISNCSEEFCLLMEIDKLKKDIKSIKSKNKKLKKQIKNIKKENKKNTTSTSLKITKNLKNIINFRK